MNTNKNTLLGRYEIIFEVRHPKEPTPKVYELRKALSSLLASKLESTFIIKVESKSGEPRSLGEAHIYSSEDDARRFEPEHVIVLNMEPTLREEELKRLSQSRAEKKATLKRGGKR